MQTWLRVQDIPCLVLSCFYHMHCSSIGAKIIWLNILFVTCDSSFWASKLYNLLCVLLCIFLSFFSLAWMKTFIWNELVPKIKYAGNFVIIIWLFDQVPIECHQSTSVNSESFLKRVGPFISHHFMDMVPAVWFRL